MYTYMSCDLSVTRRLLRPSIRDKQMGFILIAFHHLCGTSCQCGQSLQKIKETVRRPLATEFLVNYLSMMTKYSISELPKISDQEGWCNFVIQRLREDGGKHRKTNTAAAEGLESGDRVVFMRADDTWLPLTKDGKESLDRIPPKLEFIVLFERVSQS
eukprot:GHVU01178356.1.p1 GENE.GHVU01178356.1~~GHVU01178356.1.p1  ORF type:complete len:158 (+),score=5.04 GHVU01178356.1:226-699(+)